MNILIFSWRDPKHPLAGGAEQVMHEHAKGWVKAGHSVTLFTAHFKGAPRNEILDNITIIRRGYQLLGVHILGFLWYLFEKHEKFDLVVDQFHGIPFFTPLYVKAKKLAVLQEIAKEVWLMNALPFPLNWIIGGIGYVLEPYLFLFYKNIPFMTGSDSSRKDLRKFGIAEENITIVLHGVILDLPKVLPKKETIKTVVYLGALTKDKGIEDALQAVALANTEVLKKTGRTINYWIIGRGSDNYKDYLNSLTRRLGIERTTSFYGYVSNTEKFKLLSRAHVLINPSAREGWGLVNIEANAVGTPVVGYSSAGLVDSVKNGISGVLCTKNTPNEMASELEKILLDEKFYRKLQIGALNWSKIFSWNNSIQESLQLIHKITNV